MERFTGVKDEYLNQLRLDFCDLYDNNIVHMDGLFEQQLISFNNFNNFPPMNYVGSHYYEKYKSRIYESLFETYAKIRLYKVFEKSLKELKPLENLKMKAGYYFDRIFTKNSVNAYRDARINSFADYMCKFIGNTNTKGMPSKECVQVASSILEFVAQKSKKINEFSSSEELNAYFIQHKEKTFKRLEEDALNWHERGE